MTKKLKRVHIGMMSLADISKISSHLCAWEGCTASCAVTDRLPRGWRWLALWAGPVAAPPWGDQCTQDRDAVLCPTHAAELHNVVLRDIGQHLHKTEGSA